MDREQIAWAAGLFEGEGSLGCYHQRSPAPVIRACIDMTDEDVVRKFASIVSLGFVRAHDKKHEGWKNSWRWETSSFQGVQAIIAMFWPWLGERRKAKAREVLVSYRQLAARREVPLVRRMFNKPFNQLTLTEGRAYAAVTARRFRERQKAEA